MIVRRTHSSSQDHGLCMLKLPVATANVLTETEKHPTKTSLSSWLNISRTAIAAQVLLQARSLPLARLHFQSSCQMRKTPNEPSICPLALKSSGSAQGPPQVVGQHPIVCASPA